MDKPAGEDSCRLHSIKVINGSFSIADNGPGLKRNISNRFFNPFKHRRIVMT
jgi:nitrogen-specific signal transduction histidine kinase